MVSMARGRGKVFAPAVWDCVGMSSGAGGGGGIVGVVLDARAVNLFETTAIHCAPHNVAAKIERRASPKDFRVLHHQEVGVGIWDWGDRVRPLLAVGKAHALKSALNDGVTGEFLSGDGAVHLYQR